VEYVPIIRGNYCVYAALGTCYSVWITVWYAGYLAYRVTNTKFRIDTSTVISADDLHIVDRKM